MSVHQLGDVSICNLHNSIVCLLCVSLCVSVYVHLSKLQVLVHDFLFSFFLANPHNQNVHGMSSIWNNPYNMLFLLQALLPTGAPIFQWKES